MSIINFKILKNMPTFDAYGQYFYDENESLQEFYQSTGVETIFTSDDLYTIITHEDILNPSNDPDYMSNWRPIINAYVGTPADITNDQNLSIQKYYPFVSSDYLKTSAPNQVHLFVDITDDNKDFDINIYNYASSPPTENFEELYFKVFDWDWEPGGYYSNDFNGVIDQNTSHVYNGGAPGIISHQYNSSGLKTIKGVVWSIKNDGQTSSVKYKNFETKVYLGIDDVYIEDFIDIGGPDFTYLPWPTTSPIIGGFSEESKYNKSVETIVRQNNFSEQEKYEKYLAKKSYLNEELGESLGDIDIEQVRAFKVGFLDLNYMLGLYGSQVVGGNLYSSQDVGEFGYWNCSSWNDSRYNCFLMNNSVGNIFIDESLDRNLIDNTLFEFQCGDINISNLIDTSGNGNKGILIGDYEIKKEMIDITSIRDSVITLPETGDKNGAL